MISEIDKWIDETLSRHLRSRTACDALEVHLDRFFPADFLAKSYFVAIDELPKPDFPELYDLGLGGFLEMDADGITYKDTYFIKPHLVDQLDLHFHELVHVAQWQHLGAQAFIERYIREYNPDAYEESPLEKMAYYLQSCFNENRGQPIDVPLYVRKHLK